MAFSSNWPQPTNLNQQHQLQENGSIVSGYGLLSHQLSPIPPNPNPNPNLNPNHHHAASNGMPPRTGGSMAERARQAKVPPPDLALNCPRCDSTNTKFCYYNNYNLTQPRYFCKACRRYWTRGGALRNVPVGGGCRKNSKKGKIGNSSKSSSSSKQSSSAVNAPSHSTSLGQLSTNHQQFPFLPTLHNLTQLGGIGLNLAASNGNNNNQAYQLGSSFMNDLGSIHDNNNNNENNLMASAGSLSNFSLFDPATGLCTFQNEGNIRNNVGISFPSTSLVDSRAYQVKMEEQANLVVNLTKPVSASGLTSTGRQTNHYFWNNSDISGPSSDDHHQLL